MDSNHRVRAEVSLLCQLSYVPVCFSVRTPDNRISNNLFPRGCNPYAPYTDCVPAHAFIKPILERMNILEFPIRSCYTITSSERTYRTKRTNFKFFQKIFQILFSHCPLSLCAPSDLLPAANSGLRRICI